MENKNLISTLKGKRPMNGLYALIPANKRKDFKRFAACFGFTDKKIRTILENEK